MSTTRTDGNQMYLENDSLRVVLDVEALWFDVLDKETGVLWEHDPWKDSPGTVVLVERESPQAAGEETPYFARAGSVAHDPGIHQIGMGATMGRAGQVEPARLHLDLADAIEKAVRPSGDNSVEITASGFEAADGALDVSVKFSLTLDPAGSELTLELAELTIPEDSGYVLETVHLPGRAFGLRTATDEGCLIYPHWEGMVFPVGGKESGVARYSGSYTWCTGMEPFQ